jgi:hypothetical protein
METSIRRCRQSPIEALKDAPGLAGAVYRPRLGRVTSRRGESALFADALNMN